MADILTEADVSRSIPYLPKLFQIWVGLRISEDATMMLT